MEVYISEASFDPWEKIQQYQQDRPDMQGKYGATSIFVGTMRDFNEGDDVKGMCLEHYPGMTEKQLLKLMEQAARQWQLIDMLVIHRVGDVFPDDPIVLVAVWSSHRGDAFDASRFIMEALKSKAPFWKKEILASQEQRWVARNTDGYKKQDE